MSTNYTAQPWLIHAARIMHAITEHAARYCKMLQDRAALDKYAALNIWPDIAKYFSIGRYN